MTETTASQTTAGLWAALIVLWFVLSVVYRVRVGKPLFAGSDPSAMFAERWASGRAGSGIVARMSIARNCLHVRVDRDCLRIHPHFPFTLGFVPEIYGMDHVVPLDRVRSAHIAGGRHAKLVDVNHRLADGQEQTLQLLLRDPERFIQALLGSRPAA